MPTFTDPRILVDASTRDDAAVYQLAPDRAIVATVDFFTPIVDDAYDFGRIAAANAFSDVYAMGATPLFALNSSAGRATRCRTTYSAEVLRGGADIARQDAGAFVLGGHSVDDPGAEIRHGRRSARSHPNRVTIARDARVGDVPRAHKTDRHRVC